MQSPRFARSVNGFGITFAAALVTSSSSAKILPSGLFMTIFRSKSTSIASGAFGFSFNGRSSATTLKLFTGAPAGQTGMAPGISFRPL